MHRFQYRESWMQLLTPEIVVKLARIHESKGKQCCILPHAEGRIGFLLEEARMQSIEASNRIEGIWISRGRLKPLTENRAVPSGANEMIFAGYRDALKNVSENHDYQPMTLTSILQLHQLLFQYQSEERGRLKSADCAQAIECMCSEYEAAIEAGADPLLLIPMVMIDFLRIEPFERGNGQMSRLLMLLLLYRAGYYVGKFVSLEKLIALNKKEYDEAFAVGCAGGDENKNDGRQFTEYLLGLIDEAYHAFIPQAERWVEPGYSKQDRILDYLRDAQIEVSKQDIISKYPDISEITIKRTLGELVRKGTIRKKGKARATTYRYIEERE